MISYICIVISIFIPIGCTVYAKLTNKGYNNSTPREFLASLKGRGQRANFAQQNFYETFPAFAVGVVVAHQLHVESFRIDFLAMSYIISRILYAVFYILDKHILRSLAWFVAFGSILALYISGF